MKLRYVATAETDIGIVKDTNQDSVLIKHATYGKSEVLMAIICDGMGGLSKGEVASATVIREFDKWFLTNLEFELRNPDMDVIGGKWALLLKNLNIKIQEYGQSIGERLGTTFTGALFINNKYLVVHVGDTRLYRIDKTLQQLTNDHTYVAREVLKGNLTPEQAKTDKRRNMLLQCVGASKIIEPQIICGDASKCVYLLCSDGLRHRITDEEISESFIFKDLRNKTVMHTKSKKMIALVKERKEKDNISVVLIKSLTNSKGTNKISVLKRFLSSYKQMIGIGFMFLAISLLLFIYSMICM